MTRAILVTGATGNQGGSLIKALQKAEADFTIYALTRDPSSAGAQSLVSSPSVKVITGNLDEPEQIFSSIPEQVWGVFSVQIPIGRNASPAIEERQGKALIDSAIKHGVQHIVYTTGDRGGKEKSDVTPTNAPTYAAKYRVEQHLREKAASSSSAVTWTILRPVGFMENFKPGFPGKLMASMWKSQIPPTKTMQYISALDIGYFAAQSFIHSNSPDYKNQALSIAGDELTFDQADAICLEKTGKPLPQTFGIVPWLVVHLMTDIGAMMSWIGNEGPKADIAEARRLHPGLLSFADWIEQKSGLKEA